MKSVSGHHDRAYVGCMFRHHAPAPDAVQMGDVVRLCGAPLAWTVQQARPGGVLVLRSGGQSRPPFVLEAHVSHVDLIERQEEASLF